MDKKDVLKALLTAFITAITAAVGLIFKYIDPPVILSEIWQRVFVGPWFLWLGAAGFGVYWLLRFLYRINQQVTIALPSSIQEQKDHAEKRITAKTRELELLISSSEFALNQEKQNRVAGDDIAGQHLIQGLAHLQKELFDLINKEVKERTDGINALSHRIGVEFERINKIETSLSNDFLARLQELERKFSVQISDLRQRIDKPVLPGLLNSDQIGLGLKPYTPEGLGLLNRSVSTPKELITEALLEQKKNTKT